jgi:hypothetical protein
MCVFAESVYIDGKARYEPGRISTALQTVFRGEMHA